MPTYEPRKLTAFSTPFAGLLALALFAAPALSQTSVDTSLQFTTTAQDLFADSDSKVIPVADIVSESIGPLSTGQIVNVPQEVPVEFLQDAWQQAMEGAPLDLPVVGESLEEGGDFVDFVVRI